MFADVTPVEEPSTLVSLLPVIGWFLVGVLVLVAVWKLFDRYGIPDFNGLADRFRGLVVMRGRTTDAEEGGAPAAPSAPEADSAAAPPTATAEVPAAHAAAPPRRAPLPDDVDGEAPAVEDAPSAGAIKALIVAAALPSLFALPYIDR